MSTISRTLEFTNAKKGKKKKQIALKTPKLTTLAERLDYALNLRNTNQSEISRKINISPQAVQKITSGQTKKPRFLYELARALEISPAWLAAGEGPISYDENTTSPIIDIKKHLPIISWQNASQWVADKSSRENLLEDKWVWTDIEAGPDSFALVVNDNSMSGRFDNGTVIIIDPADKPRHNDFVIAYIKDAKEAIFRQFLIENDNVKLVPLNLKLYKLIELSKEDFICGVMIQARTDFKR